MKDKRDIGLFLIVMTFTIVFFGLKTYGDTLLFAEVVAFAIMAYGALIAALYTQADEDYYENLKPIGLLWIAAAAFGMFALSSFFMAVFVPGGSATGASVLWHPTVYGQLTSTNTSTSIFTAMLGEIVFQIAIVACGEEFIKFAGYTILLDKYESMLLAIGLPVGLWAGFHMIQAWTNPLLVIPAFLCGLILIFLLRVTKTPIAPVMAHGIYNSSTVILTVISAIQAGTLSVGVPWFPISPSPNDVILIALAAIWIALIVLPAVFGRTSGLRK